MFSYIYYQASLFRDKILNELKLWGLPYGLFCIRKVIYHFSLSKVISQKTKFDTEYLTGYYIKKQKKTEILP